MLPHATLATVLVALSQAAPPLSGFQESDQQLEPVANIPVAKHAHMGQYEQNYPRFVTEDSHILISPPNQLQDSKEKLETMANEPFSKTVPIYSMRSESTGTDGKSQMNETEKNPTVSSSDMENIIPESAITAFEEIVGSALTQLMSDGKSTSSVPDLAQPSNPNTDENDSSAEFMGELLHIAGASQYEQKVILKIIQSNDVNNVLSNFLIKILNYQATIELEKMEDMMLKNIRRVMLYHLYKLHEMKMVLRAYAGNGQNGRSDKEYFMKFPYNFDTIKPAYIGRQVFNPLMPASIISVLRDQLNDMWTK